jgi:hypothetical protein
VEVEDEGMCLQSRSFSVMRVWLEAGAGGEDGEESGGAEVGGAGGGVFFLGCLGGIWGRRAFLRGRNRPRGVFRLHKKM